MREARGSHRGPQACSVPVVCRPSRSQPPHRASPTTSTPRYSAIPWGISTTPPLHRARTLVPSSSLDASTAPARASTSPAHTHPHNRSLKRLPAAVVHDSTSIAPPHRPPRHPVSIAFAPPAFSADLQFATSHASSTTPRRKLPPSRCQTPVPASAAGSERCWASALIRTSPPRQLSATSRPRNHTLPRPNPLDVDDRQLRAVDQFQPQLRMFGCHCSGSREYQQSGNLPISGFRLS
jgi:hypothetical protein